jgi:hypothetical protein
MKDWESHSAIDDDYYDYGKEIWFVKFTSAVKVKRFKVPKPDIMFGPVMNGQKFEYTYMWFKSRLDKNKLQHALNGNTADVTFYRRTFEKSGQPLNGRYHTDQVVVSPPSRSDPPHDLMRDGDVESNPGFEFVCKCGHSFILGGASNKAKCMKCKAMLHAKGGAASAAHPTRQNKNADLIEKSLSDTRAKMAGDADARIEAQEAAPEKVEPPPPYENDAKYYLLSPLALPRPRFVLIDEMVYYAVVLLVFCYAAACVVYYSNQINRVMDAVLYDICVKCLCFGLFRYCYAQVAACGVRHMNFIEFTLYATNELSMPDMRPDFMAHTKLKHGPVQGSVRIQRTSSCHIRGHREDTNPRGLLAWIRYYTACLIFGNVGVATAHMYIDVEVFNQIKPSIPMIPSKTVTDRIDNHISRLSSVNCNRRSNVPVFSNTSIVLKAYHWHYVAIKEDAGYFSPYELTLPTRV